MKTRLISIAAGFAALSLVLTGCSSAKFGEGESPSVVVKFDSKVKYFATFNGNMSAFFKSALNKNAEVIANNKVNITISNDSGVKRYRLMVKPTIITTDTLIIDTAKASSKKCSFPATIASSYWDMDSNMIQQQFVNAPKDAIYATNNEGTEAYLFTPNKDKKSGLYLAASLTSKHQLTKIQSGVYSNTIDVTSDKLPKLTPISSEMFYGSDLSKLPVNLNNSQWIDIAGQLKKLPPRGDEVNFYGITSGGSIVKATYKNKSCNVQ